MAKHMRVSMDVFYERAVKAVQQFTGGPDRCHHEVCSMLCDDFDVWESVKDVGHSEQPITTVRLPMWVMYIVSGIMRDQGVDQ